MQIIKSISFIFVLVQFGLQNQLVSISKSKLMSDKNNTSLKVIFELPGEIYSGHPCEIAVQIINVSNDTIIVNKRLAIGYEVSLSRELYAKIYNSETLELSGVQKVLYERQFSPRGDYIQLLPKQKISSKFNLFDWYELPKPGKYTIQICYQADEELAFKPEGLCQGIFCSDKKSVIFK